MSMSFVEKQKQTQLSDRRLVVHTTNMANEYVAAAVAPSASRANLRLKFTTSGARIQHCCFCLLLFLLQLQWFACIFCVIGIY